jgi:hypothetical protein
MACVSASSEMLRSSLINRPIDRHARYGLISRKCCIHHRDDLNASLRLLRIDAQPHVSLRNGGAERISA